MVKPSVAQCDGPEGAPPTVDTVAQLQILVDRAESTAGKLAGAADAAASSASDADKSAKAAKEALNKTAEIAVSTPYIGANGNWIVWDAEKASYVDSGVRAVGNDANVTADNINKALGFTPADSESVSQIRDDLSALQTAAERKYAVKTVMDSVAIPHTQYFLGVQTAVEIVLPDAADVGQIISVSWYNGDTAATLSITGTMLDFDYTASTNSRSEINALWDGTYWSVLGQEMAVV